MNSSIQLVLSCLHLPASTCSKIHTNLIMGCLVLYNREAKRVNMGLCDYLHGTGTQVSK